MKKNVKSNTYLLTFIVIAGIILLTGYIGVRYSINTAKAKYINQQLNLNKRTAETISQLLSNQLDKGVSQEKVLEMFQKAIIGNHVNEGYLCMFDQSTASLLCHPNTEMIGQPVTGEAFQFDNLLENEPELLENAVSTQEAEGGILSLKEPTRSEITYMVPVEGTSWKVSVHENTEKMEDNLALLKKRAYSGFIALAFVASILATIASRRVGSRYERQIEQKNFQLAEKNAIQKEQNTKIEEQKNIIEDYANDLEKKVEKRTHQLAEAHAKLEHLEKAKSDFLGIISHELRTPLNGIIGFSDILEHELQGSEHEESVQNIKESGYRLMKFSETALRITELSSQNKALDFKENNIAQLFEEAEKLYETELQHKNITIEHDFPKEDIKIQVVKELVIECLSNIYKNALKYTPEKGKILTKCYEKKSSTVCEITDTGPGFSEEALSRLFEYFGADNVMHHTEGFGLGLSAANLIMEAHSGKIEVENCPEKAWGARVRIIFNHAEENGNERKV